MIKIYEEREDTLYHLIESEIDNENIDQDEGILILQEIQYNSQINESDLPLILNSITTAIEETNNFIPDLLDDEDQLYKTVTDRKKLRDLESYLQLYNK